MSDFLPSVNSQGKTNSKPAEEAPESRQEPSDLAERAETFRALMAGLPLTDEQQAMLGGHPSGSGDLKRRGVDISEMLAMQRTIDLAFPPPVEAPPASVPPDLSIAELMEKHVRRTLASEGISPARTGELRLELSDAVLPGTSLSLRQTPEGWQLSATADNRQSLDKLNEFAPELVRRFSQASLGRLEVRVDSKAALMTGSARG